MKGQESVRIDWIVYGLIFGFPVESIEYFVNNFGANINKLPNRFSGSGFIEGPLDNMSMKEIVDVINKNSLVKTKFHWSEKVSKECEVIKSLQKPQEKEDRRKFTVEVMKKYPDTSASLIAIDHREKEADKVFDSIREKGLLSENYISLFNQVTEINKLILSNRGKRK